jgi:hypothetical protein
MPQESIHLQLLDAGRAFLELFELVLQHFHLSSLNFNTENLTVDTSMLHDIVMKDDQAVLLLPVTN